MILNCRVNITLEGTGSDIRRRRIPVEDTMDKILQHQKITYELLAAMFGDEPILEDEYGRWPGFRMEESA